jgi:hypothetical protein
VRCLYITASNRHCSRPDGRNQRFYAVLFGGGGAAGKKGTDGARRCDQLGGKGVPTRDNAGVILQLQVQRTCAQLLHGGAVAVKQDSGTVSGPAFQAEDVAGERISHWLARVDRSTSWIFLSASFAFFSAIRT